MDMFSKGYSRKQAGVIYRNVKEGKIEMSKTAISVMYDNVGTVEIVDNTTAEFAQEGVTCIRLAVDAIFADDYRLAQMHISDFEREFAA